MEHTPEVTFIATKQGAYWIGEVIDLRTQASLYRSQVSYTTESAAKSAAASAWRVKQAGVNYRVLHVTATGEQAVHAFVAASLADAARVALQPKYYRPWCATVLIDDMSGQRYSIHDCEELIKPAEVAA